MIHTVRSLFNELKNLVYPGRCAVCKVGVDQGKAFCPGCDNSLSGLETRPQCLKCGAPLAEELSSCQRCRGRGYRLFDRVIRVSTFENPYAELIRRFKYYHGWGLGELLAERAHQLQRVRGLLETTDILVPVPLHPWRQMIRGFNQAQVFASRIGRLSGLPVHEVVIRVQNTPQQALLSGRERVRNVRGVFELIGPRQVQNRRVVIIDDVFTSASTLKEVARVISRACPISISVLAIAAADPKGHGFQVA